MRVVSKRTGLSPDVLRVWERRYGLVKPVRSAGWQRLYSDEDVERLRLLAMAVKAGRTIGQIAPMEISALRALVAEDLAVTSGSGVGARPRLGSDDSGVAPLLHSIQDFNARSLENSLREEALRRGTDRVVDELVVPLLRAVGDGWHTGRLSAAHEHLATTTVRRVLGWLFAQAAPAEDAPAVVVTTPSGQVHELGALLAATIAAGRGWRVVYLGKSLPAADIVVAAERAGAVAVALSLVYPAADTAIRVELEALRARLPAGIALTVGGASAASYAPAEVGAELITDLGAWRTWLDAARLTTGIRSRPA